MPVQHLINPHRGQGLGADATLAAGDVIADPGDALALFRRCPAAERTPLCDLPDVAGALGVQRLFVKDESRRMGLGSFKALGATHAIARAAVQSVGEPDARDADTMRRALAGRVFACASAGNHGLSVAAGGRLFGAKAVIFVSETVPESFVRRLRGKDATVVRTGGDYDASMAAAADAAEANGWTLLSDSSWPGYVEWPRRVMEGYLIVAAEVAQKLGEPPSHVFLQAGVGGFAAAMTAFVRSHWGEDPLVVVVEPEAAPALTESIRAGRAVTTTGPASSMGRLDCKAPSHLALADLARCADHFLAISDELVDQTVDLLAAHGILITPSGAAGVAGLHHAGEHRAVLGLTPESRVLTFITEGPEEPA